MDLGLLGGAISEATESAARVLLWVVDPEACGRCLVEGFGAWNALGGDLDLRRRLVVVGESVLPYEGKRSPCSRGLLLNSQLQQP